MWALSWLAILFWVVTFMASGVVLIFHNEGKNNKYQDYVRGIRKHIAKEKINVSVIIPGSEETDRSPTSIMFLITCSVLALWSVLTILFCAFLSEWITNLGRGTQLIEFYSHIRKIIAIQLVLLIIADICIGSLWHVCNLLSEKDKKKQN